MSALPGPRPVVRVALLGALALSLCVFAAWPVVLLRAQQAPPAPAPSGARILLLPRRLVAGERSTLAVLDVHGRLTPGVAVIFSNGDRVTTDSTGRARFVAPLKPGVLLGALEGRPGRVPTTILTTSEALSDGMVVSLAPRVAALSDRFELLGAGFCGDADANRVTIAGREALVLAASPASLVVLPPENLSPGPAVISAECLNRSAAPFAVTFVALELSASSATLAPNERRSLLVLVYGTKERVAVEARNLAPDIAELSGGNPVRITSTGGAENTARFEVIGRQRGKFLISVRLVSPLGPPRP